MIGVIANPLDHSVVTEFFELFKTPWEFCRVDREYDVVLFAGGELGEQRGSKLTLIFSGCPLPYDANERIALASKSAGRMLSYQGTRLPIYGDCVSFVEEQTSHLVDEESRQATFHRKTSRNGSQEIRIGYDILSEVRTLLTSGQPLANAAIPTLDLHIGLVRDLIVESGAFLLEIPPVPDGYRFIACLTHDVDHPSLRSHKFDHTMFGFLYRAVPGSFSDWVRGRRSGGELLSNLWAALKLPFIYLGLADDFWQKFDDYARLENGAPSTFFVIPFKGRPGKTREGMAPDFRSSGYGAADVADQVNNLRSAGCEVGLHGIDAWFDSSSGREELQEIRKLTGELQIGVRMHWLYFDRQSPSVLEQAGAAYDSTVGYNETIGYRAGTTQAYKPLDATQLLELPMHIMDTALFYPSYLNLSQEEATQQVAPVIAHAVKCGGAIIVNWHDRSIAPERLWGDSYVGLIAELKRQGAWFATAGDAAAWFRMRRSATFNADQSGAASVKVDQSVKENLPGLCSRIYQAQGANHVGAIAAR